MIRNGTLLFGIQTKSRGMMMMVVVFLKILIRNLVLEGIRRVKLKCQANAIDTELIVITSLLFGK